MGLREIASKFREGLREKSSFYRQLIERSELKDRQLKELDSLILLSQKMSNEPILEEFVINAFGILEKGLKLNKFLFLMKDSQDEFRIFDGYGCREETHKKFHFKTDSLFFNMLPKKNPEIYSLESFPWDLFFSEEDHQESNQMIFAPLLTKGSVSGYLVILKTPEGSDLEWLKKMIALAASIFSVALTFQTFQTQS